MRSPLAAGAGLVLVSVSTRQEAEDGSTWLIDLEYQGERSPEAEPPKAEFDSAPFTV